MIPRTETKQLRDIVAEMDDRNPEEWFTVMGIEIDGMVDAHRRANDDDEDIANAGFEDSIRLEEEYLKERGGDWYRVTWPQHVLPKARYNSDAWYQPVSGPDPVDGDSRNGSEA